MQERRRHHRLEEQNEVGVTVLASPVARELEEQTFFCRTSDLSASGLQLRLHRAMPEGCALALRIAFSDPLKAFRLLGRVNWCRSCGPASSFAVGVDFKDCPAQVLAQWAECVASKSRILAEAMRR